VTKTQQEEMRVKVRRDRSRRLHVRYAYVKNDKAHAICRHTTRGDPWDPEGLMATHTVSAAMHRIIR
jgi:type II secretory pathway component PulJ